VRLEAYLKDKLEFEGMIVDAGVRLAMSHAGGEWFTYDPFTKVFRGFQSYGADTLLPQQSTKYITNVMPRLNIAFPISENAKLYFNYGHFRSLPTPENLYLIRHENTTGDIVRLADPNLPLEKTVAYELGYEHNLFDMFLLRIAAYYKDISNERYLVEHIGYGSVPDYTVSTANLYEDIRGFEITLRKNRGNWLQGFVNYTYSVGTSGHFGWPVYEQSQVDQINYELGNPPIQNVPIPQPYARANLDFFTPPDFGPKFAGIDVFGDWRLSVLGSWNSGNYFTWVGGGSFPGVANNIKWTDTYSCDLRVSKNFQIGPANLQLFVDINNALNLKQMSHYGFYDATDYTDYLMSLHLPGGWNADGAPTGFDQYYGNIPGNDKPGDYRKAGVDYQPMVFSANIKTISSPYARPIYYDKITQQYYRWTNNQWTAADPNEVNKVLSDKAYIHMPTQDWFTFLNPRDVYFGARISFDVF